MPFTWMPDQIAALERAHRQRTRERRKAVVAGAVVVIVTILLALLIRFA